MPQIANRILRAAAPTSVLVVGDGAGVCDLLTQAGHPLAVTVAVDARAALAALARAEVDVVLSDLRAATELLGHTADTPVVAMTGHATLDAVAVARALEHRALRDASALREQGQLVLANREPARLPELIVQTAVRLLGADRATLWLEDGTSTVADGPSDPALVGRVSPLHPARGREPTLVDLGAEGTAIRCPLLSGDHKLGQLDLHRDAGARPFRARDVGRAAVLASQALLGLENARHVRAMMGSDRVATIARIAAGIAHEINNPLAAVLANQEVLQMVLAGHPEHTEAREILDDLALGVMRIREVSRDLGVLARDGDGPCDLNQAVQSALRITAASIRRAAVLETELGTGLHVRGDVGRLSQLFVTLLANAALALGDGEHRVGVSTAREGNRVVARVFISTTDPALDLATCRDIARGHGGELSLTSTSGDGTCFTLVLPYFAGRA